MFPYLAGNETFMKLRLSSRLSLILLSLLLLTACSSERHSRKAVEYEALSFVATLQQATKGIPSQTAVIPAVEEAQSVTPNIVEIEPIHTEQPIPEELQQPSPAVIVSVNDPQPENPTIAPADENPVNNPETPADAKLIQPANQTVPSVPVQPAAQIATPAEISPFGDVESNPFDPTPGATAQAAADKPLYQPVVVNPKANGANWKQYPVVPAKLSKTASDIYWYGVKTMGRNGKYFSKVGDCHSFANVFLGEFDYLYGSYKLTDGDLKLEDAILYFQQSFNAVSYAVANGLSAASALTTIWSDPYNCNYGESALMCEIRINNPSIIFVNLGTNWVVGTDPSVYYDYLDEIVYKLIQNGVLPILSTKGDNIEGNHKINELTVAIAEKYDLPVYNFWAQAQTLPNKGLDVARDNIHLAVEAWSVRSYWGLKTLYAVGHDLGLF